MKKEKTAQKKIKVNHYTVDMLKSEIKRLKIAHQDNSKHYKHLVSEYILKTGKEYHPRVKE